MSQLQVFENELFKVSAITDGGQILFDVEEIARCLGFTDKKNGIEYVRWSRVNSYLPSNSPQVAKGDLIPEPLVYKLAFKAQNEVAEQFQDWLAIDVVPTIRETGGYSMPMSPTELALLQAQNLHNIEKTVKTHDKKLTRIERKVNEQMTLDYGMQRRLQKAVAARVYKIDDDQQARRKLFSELYREIKDRFGVASYKDVRRQDLQTAINYVENWIPRKVAI